MEQTSSEITEINLPEEFILQLKTLFPAFAESVIHGYQQKPVVSVRVNPKKIHANQLSEFEVVNWEPNACYLSERPLFTADPLFHAGAYYVQEASSMFVGFVVRELLKNHPISRVLDLSAAPGGKTTHLCAILPDSTLLVANEIIPARARILKETMQKWGASNCVVTQNKPEDFNQLPHFFDVIVADAPCSGEGMFRKDPESIAHWNTEAVKNCSERQMSIISDCWNSLKPGGFFLYSTCTLNSLENETVAEFIQHTMGARPVFFPDVHSFGVYADENSPVYRCFPGLVQGEGFSFMCFQKNENTSFREIPFKSSGGKKLVPVKKEVVNLLQPFAKKTVEWFQFMESFIALPKQLSADIQFVFGKLYVIKAGVTLGELKGREIRPESEWVLSDLFDEDSLPAIELTYEQAVAYLKRETLDLENCPSGFCVISYKNIVLGTGKYAGNRLNNLYPANWRIRMSISEEAQFSLLGL